MKLTIKSGLYVKIKYILNVKKFPSTSTKEAYTLYFILTFCMARAAHNTLRGEGFHYKALNVTIKFYGT